MCDRLLFFWQDLLPTWQGTNPCTQSSCLMERKQPGSGAPFPVQLVSRAGPCASTVPHLIPLRATGYPRHKKREWQSTLFSGCDAKTKVIFHINAHDIFLNTERGFSCYKNYPSLLSQMSLYFLSQVFHWWFFSSFALIFCSVEQVQSMLLAEKTLKNPSCPLPD